MSNLKSIENFLKIADADGDNPSLHVQKVDGDWNVRLMYDGKLAAQRYAPTLPEALSQMATLCEAELKTVNQERN